MSFELDSLERLSVVICFHLTCEEVLGFDPTLINLVLDKKICDVQVLSVLSRGLLSIDLKLNGTPVVLMKYCGM